MIARLIAPWRRLHAGLVMGRKARVDCFQTAADLLDAGFELERALAVTARALGGKGGRARLIASWGAALPAGRFAQAMADTVPAAEAMIPTRSCCASNARRGMKTAKVRGGPDCA